MLDVNIKAGNLHKKIEKLVYLFAQEKRAKAELVAERDRLLQISKSQQLENEALTHQLAIAKASLALNKGGEQSTAMKLKINKLVKKIDQSIAILNK